MPSTSASDRSDDRIVFEVAVEPSADPIAGQIRTGREEVGFVGWVGLASALERILEQPGADRRRNFGVDPP